MRNKKAREMPKPSERRPWYVWVKFGPDTKIVETCSVRYSRALARLAEASTIYKDGIVFLAQMTPSGRPDLSHLTPGERARIEPPVIQNLPRDPAYKPVQWDGPMDVVR